MFGLHERVCGYVVLYLERASVQGMAGSDWSICREATDQFAIATTALNFWWLVNFQPLVAKARAISQLEILSMHSSILIRDLQNN